jgi:class 3 adenylate cyclase
MCERCPLRLRPVRACPGCGEQAPDEARFCPVCGTALGTAPAAPGLRKIVTIVRSDLVGSTTLGETLSPETLRQVLDRYFDAMAEVLMRHEGASQTFIGDAVMAVFGIPTVHEDDALRAVRAAKEMRSALRELNEQLDLRWGVRLQARTGLNTGEVIVGDPSHGEAFVGGEAVNIATQLERSAPPREILVGEQTLELVRGAVLVQAVPPVAVEGKREPVRAFRLLDVATPDRGIDRGLSSPLVGRERELQVLREAFDRTVSAGTCELVTLVGPAGVGKTRLTSDFLRSLGGAATAATGRCLSYGQGLTFWPLREIVAELAGTEDGDGPDEVLTRLSRLLPPDDDRATVAERVAAALGVVESAAYPEDTFWAVRKLFEAVARERPLVVMLEDVQWAEPTLLELIEYLPVAIGSLPVLLIAVTRAELFDVRPNFAQGVPGARRIDVQPLSEADSQALVKKLVAEAGVAADVADRVAASAEGNPLFVEELVRMLIDERHLGQDPSALPMPPTIHAVLAARLDRLDSTELAVVKAAAVIGKSFSDEAALMLAGGPGHAEPESHLGALVRKGIIEADGGRFGGRRTFSFKHILLRDVAYQGILKAQRADLHERYADWLEGEAGERASEYHELLGHHLERAAHNLSELAPIDERLPELSTRAARHLGASGTRALARGDIRPAVSLLERAVSLLPEDDPARRDLTLKLGIGLAESGDLSRADALLADRIRAERRGRAFVAFHDGAGSQRVVTLENERSPITIGRRADNDIVLSWDSEVSRRHAHLLHLGEGWALVDDDSRNGSYLNGERVTRQRPLRDGDVFRFGDTVVLFRAPVPDEHRARDVFLAPEQVTYMGQSTTHAPKPAAE